MNQPVVTGKIVFFDGVCLLCNRTVDFLIRADRGRKLKFASLQSTVAKQTLPGNLMKDKFTDTVIFIDSDKIYTHSTAILRIIGCLPFPYPLALIFLAIPKFLRDWLYNIIAKYRYNWFGKRESCRMPDARTYDRIIG